MVRYNPIILTHLGESVPPYLRDCIKQIRLWNPLANIYLILDDCHKNEEKFTSLEDEYDVKLAFRSMLQQTPAHKYFLENFKFLLSYPGRGAFYIFCGSLALANTGAPAGSPIRSACCPYPCIFSPTLRKIILSLPVCSSSSP